MPHLLIVEDDLTFSLMLKTWLGKQGFAVDAAGSVKAAVKRLLDGPAYDLILSDLRLPDEEGLFLLDWLRQHGRTTPVIIMTSYAEVQNAVAAMKHGACDYIAKPVQQDILLEKIRDALSVRPTSAPATAPKERPTSEPGPTRYLEGTSPAAQQLYHYVDLVAPTPMSVLITGDSGTGKEYVARRIHERSKRADKPFVAIDCGSMMKDLAASEFFGHVKGAFTGAVTDKVGAFVEANGGTLFLDEVGNLGYDVQVQLLRALQERLVRQVGGTQETKVDIRLICATNENLPAAIARGEFREDLYHRINEFTIAMPRLCERGRDVLLFANFFLQQANRELERHVEGFDAGAEEALLHYSWPGNLRQLKNTVTRATLLATSSRIARQDLALPSEEARPDALRPLRDADDEKTRIERALQVTGGNKSRAAQLLGIDRKTLYNKLEAYGMR